MPQGGELTVHCADATLDAPDLAHVPELGSGDYAVLEVIDTGSGMTAEVLEHAFEMPCRRSTPRCL